MKERKLNRDKTDMEIVQEILELQEEAKQLDPDQRLGTELLIDVDQRELQWRRGQFGNYRADQ